MCARKCAPGIARPPCREPAFQPRPDLETLDLVELLSLSEEEFRGRFRGTALTRARRRGLLRNAAIVLGNRGESVALPALEKALADPEPLVREAAQWAISQINQAKGERDVHGVDARINNFPGWAGRTFTPEE